LLISFEGIDGCGKSTQINRLKEYFEQESLPYSVFREPGGTQLSEKVRSLLLHETDHMNEVTELLLFSAARSQLVSEEVLPRLDRGEIVILDRFYDSTTAYQGFGRKSAELSQIEVLNRMASHHTEPDLTLYLRITPQEASLRTQDNQKDRMEKAGDGFFQRVFDGYEELSKLQRFRTVDATRPPDQVHHRIVELIRKHPRFPG
jgi:dTMP kinase